MEMLQKSSIIMKELNRQREALTQLVYQLSDALDQKSDVREISRMIDEVTVYTDFLIKSQNVALGEQASAYDEAVQPFGALYLKHTKGIKRYYYLENFNRLTTETLAFYSDLLMDQVHAIKK